MENKSIGRAVGLFMRGCILPGFVFLLAGLGVKIMNLGVLRRIPRWGNFLSWLIFVFIISAAASVVLYITQRGTPEREELDGEDDLKPQTGLANALLIIIAVWLGAFGPTSG